MKFFEDTVLQARKRRHLVCGDFYLCSRSPSGTVAILCDGVGSGVYANVAAITCGNRLMEMVRGGRSLRSACGQVAESMNRARTEDSPFAAFVAMRILPGGQFTCYAYENPGPIFIRGDSATAIKQQMIALKYEMIAESTGMLEDGDSVLLCSDGITHAGLGGGFATGWGTEGVVGEINAYLRRDGLRQKLLTRVLHTAFMISGKAYWDDTSLAMITCRPAQELCLLTGPPSSRQDDKRILSMFDQMPGKKVICGSTTTDIAARMLGRPAKMVTKDVSLDSPPEYQMQGIDLVTEGAVTLNQAMNLLEADVDLTVGDSPVFRLCRMLVAADAITLIVGGGYNKEQSEDSLLRQLGVKPRQRIVERLAEHLNERGKLVSVRKV